MFEFFYRNNEKVTHVNDMDGLLGKVNVIDIREPYEFETGSLESAVNIPMGSLVSDPEKFLEKEKTYYILCQSGARSSQTVNYLSQKGYNVIDVVGGMGSYHSFRQTSFFR